MYLVYDCRSLHRQGSPIRKSSDQRLFVTFPGLIADYYVLHRLLVSRHSPYALINCALRKHVTVFVCYLLDFLLYNIYVLNCNELSVYNHMADSNLFESFT